MRRTPSLYANQMIAMLEKTASDDHKPLLRAFLAEIYARGHWKWIPDIVKRAKKNLYAKENMIEVTVTSAHTLDQKTINGYLQKVLPERKVITTLKIDTTLIGGVRLETEDMLWDITLSGQIQQLAHKYCS